MHVAIISFLPVILGAFATVASSLPQTKGVTFTIHQTPVKRSTPWTAARSVRRAHWKYGIKVPMDLEVAAEEATGNEGERGQASVPVRPVKGDQMYVLNVMVGASNMSLDLDTGSSDLYVHLRIPKWRCRTIQAEAE